MWVPIALAGAALWYIGSRKSAPEKEIAPEREPKHPPPEVQELLDCLISKPEEWSEIPEIPGKLIVKNKQFLKKLKAFTPEQVWGELPDWPMESFVAGFSPPRKNYHVFIVKLEDCFILVDGGGSSTYMKYAGKITRRK